MTSKVKRERAIIYWTAFLAATLFVCGFERIGGYRLKQLSELKWQLMRTRMIWDTFVSVVLLVAFITKTSEIFSCGWVLACIAVTVGMQMAGRWLSDIAMQCRSYDSHFARNIMILGLAMKASIWSRSCDNRRTRVLCFAGS